jgi:hypothetical protein
MDRLDTVDSVLGRVLHLCRRYGASTSPVDQGVVEVRVDLAALVDQLS